MLFSFPLHTPRPPPLLDLFNNDDGLVFGCAFLDGVHGEWHHSIELEHFSLRELHAVSACVLSNVTIHFYFEGAPARIDRSSERRTSSNRRNDQNGIRLGSVDR